MPYSPPAIVVSPSTVHFGSVPWEGGEAHPRFLHVTLDTRVFPRRALPHVRETGYVNSDVNAALLSEMGTDAHHVLQTYRLTLRAEDPGPVDTCVVVYPSPSNKPISWVQANALMGDNLISVTGMVPYSVRISLDPNAIDFGKVTFGKGAKAFFNLVRWRPAIKRADIRANFTHYNPDTRSVPNSAPILAQDPCNFYTSKAIAASPFIIFGWQLGMSSMNHDGINWGVSLNPSTPLGPFHTTIVVTFGKKTWALPVTATVVPAVP